MDNFRSGEVLLLAFPFSDGLGAKRRPAVVLLDVGDEDLVAARITSQPVRARADVELQDWKEAGLLTPSVVRLHKLATIRKRLISRRLGSLTVGDWEKIRSKMKELWSLI